MPYNESLSKRIEGIIKTTKGFSRKEMFGGVGYMLHGNMCVGVHKDDLIVRFDPKSTAGWLLVEPGGTKGTQLNNWIELAMHFVKTLPGK